MRADEVLSIWVIYDHPRDYPESFVVRRHDVRPDRSEPTDESYAGTLEALREQMQGRGLYPMSRSEGDDPTIVEVWL